jgi:hypothetical protein
MCGLKADVDLSFFVGKDLTQVVVGSYNVQFHFSGPVPASLDVAQDTVSLAVQNQIEHSSKGVVTEWDGDENMPLSAASLLGLLGPSVVSAHEDPDGTLTLEFSNGGVVTVFDGEHYEPCQIYHGDQTIYV